VHTPVNFEHSAYPKYTPNSNAVTNTTTYGITHAEGDALEEKADVSEMQIQTGTRKRSRSYMYLLDLTIYKKRLSEIAPRRAASSPIHTESRESACSILIRR